MGIITRMRKQKAVYWPVTGVDEYGHPTFGTAVEIDCRWDDVSEQFLDGEGQVKVSNAKVYVDRDMATGSWLWLGLLADVGDATDPVASGGYEVKKFEKTPNLKATEFLRTATL